MFFTSFIKSCDYSLKKFQYLNDQKIRCRIITFQNLVTQFKLEVKGKATP